MEKALERFEQFSFSIFEISHFWHQITSREMEQRGLKGAHTLYLLTLHSRPEGITAKELGKLCGRDKADVSRMLSSLEEKGLVRKEGSHQRSYGGVFKLTEAGRTMTDSLRSRVKLAVDLAGENLSEDARAVFYDTLSLLTANIRRLAEEGLPETDTESEDAI